MSITNMKLLQKKLDYKRSIFPTSSRLQKTRFLISRVPSQTTRIAYGFYRNKTLSFQKSWSYLFNAKKLSRQLQTRNKNWPDLELSLNLPLRTYKKTELFLWEILAVQPALKKYLPKQGKAMCIDAIVRSGKLMKVLRSLPMR